MKPENQKIIVQKILEVLTSQEIKLPDHLEHSEDVDPYTNISESLKRTTGGIGIEDLPDEMLNNILQLIQTLKDNER